MAEEEPSTKALLCPSPTNPYRHTQTRASCKKILATFSTNNVEVPFIHIHIDTAYFITVLCTPITIQICTIQPQKLPALQQ